MKKKPHKQFADAAPDKTKPEAIPEGKARSASYVISMAVHALVLLVVFFSAQFISSTPRPEPQPDFKEVTLQFDVGVPGAEGESVFDNKNPNPEALEDNPDQGKPEVVETPPTPERPKPETREKPNPTPAQPKPQVKPEPNPTHDPIPATDKPERTDPTPSEEAADNPWVPDEEGGNDPATTPANPENDGSPSPGESTNPAGPPPRPGTMAALPGWCRTKDDQNSPNKVYSHSNGGRYRCNCTLGKNVTCTIMK